MSHTLTSTRIAATFVLLVGVAPHASAQMFIPTGRDTLRGLPGVEVAVEPLEQDLEHDGLTHVAIQSDVEQRLRAGGIIVYASQRENPSEAKAYLVGCAHRAGWERARPDSDIRRPVHSRLDRGARMIAAGR